MAVSIVVGTNSYVTLADATTYLEGSVRATGWASVTTDNQNRSLVSAFRRLDRLGLVDPTTGIAIDASSAPQDVKDAQSEYAYELSQDTSLESAATASGSNTRRVQAGSVEVEFFQRESGTPLPTPVQQLVAAYLPTASATGGSVAYGTDGTSEFDCDPYGRSSGL